jgi:hypothetical protein
MGQISSNDGSNYLRTGQISSDRYFTRRSYATKLILSSFLKIGFLKTESLIGMHAIAAGPRYETQIGRRYEQHQTLIDHYASQVV